MTDVGRVTPGNPVWPEPHHSYDDEARRRRREQEQESERHERRETPELPSRPSGQPPADGHIDEYA